MEQQTKITKVRKNEDGDITNVMLEDGNVYTVDEAIQMVRDNGISGVNVGKSRSGTEFLRTDADDETLNNLDNLPTF